MDPRVKCWLFASPEQDVAAVMRVVESLVDEFGIDDFEIRDPFLREGSAEIAWMRDGTRVPAAKMTALLRVMLEAEVAVTEGSTCWFQADNGIAVRPYWDGGIKLLTPYAFPQSLENAERWGVSWWELGRERDEFSPSPYPVTGDEFRSEIVKRKVTGSRALLTEKWANGPAGHRARVIDMATDVDALMADLRQRSVVLIVDSPGFEQFDSVSEQDIEQLNLLPEGGEKQGLAIAIVPTGDSGDWHRLVDADYWYDMRADYPDLDVEPSSVLFMPAIRWSQGPPLLRYVVPDGDGVVRGIYRDGPD